MIKNGFNIRQATIGDVPFLVDTIIEAEKSGTTILSYSRIFGLSEEVIRKYISDMLYEEVDGCELSISSFFVAEKNGQVVAALSGWVEGKDQISSAELKGNLLNYVLPKESIKKAIAASSFLQEIHIINVPGSIQKGAGYILKDFRNMHLFSMLTNEIIGHLLKTNPEVTQIYTQIYGCNIAAIRANEKSNFEIVMIKESPNEDILNYLPSNKKILMKKEL